MVVRCKSWGGGALSSSEDIVQIVLVVLMIQEGARVADVVDTLELGGDGIDSEVV